ncbi:hypothetical protein JST97_05880 [bacterium]|nr:hypothetical protein [bacterium]
MKTLATVVLGMTLSMGAWAQSTDPDHPSAWASLGVNGRGVGREVTYYYSVPSEAGTIQSHVQAQGLGGTAEMSIELFDSHRAWLGSASTSAETGATHRADVPLNVPARGNLLMAVHLNRSVGEYSVWLNRPAARAARPVTLPNPADHVNPDALNAAATGRTVPPSLPIDVWENSGGPGGPQDFYYPVVVGPGAFQVQVQSTAQAWSSSLNLSLEDDAGIAYRSAGVIATTAGQTENTTWNISERRNLRLHVHVSENTGSYRWRIQGPLEH